MQDRAPKTGWVPLHEAALCGHADVCRVLINLGAPLQPRTPENETPLDIAYRCGQAHITELIGKASLGLLFMFLLLVPPDLSKLVGRMSNPCLHV